MLHRYKGVTLTIMETKERNITVGDVDFIAYEAGNPEHIIAKGNDADKVIEEANDSGIEYVFMFVPDKDLVYIL